MADNLSDEPTKDVSVRFPESFLKDQLLPEYPAATKVSDAIRMAVSNDVERRQKGMTASTVADSVIEALEEHGGEYEAVQRLTITAVNDLDIETAHSVGINKDDAEGGDGA